MSESKKSLFDIEADEQGARDEFDELRELLGQHMDEFIETHELPPGMMALLLMDLCVSLRMAEYVLATEEPSGSGLRIELDRFGREIADVVRTSKKSADEFVEASKQALAEEETKKAE
jgi:hypothetical protein